MHRVEGFQLEGVELIFDVCPMVSIGFNMIQPSQGKMLRTFILDPNVSEQEATSILENIKDPWSALVILDSADWADEMIAFEFEGCEGTH